MTTPDPIRDALKQWIVVSRYSLGNAIRQAWLKHGQNSWCTIADEVISELAPPLPAPDLIRDALKQWQDLHREDLLCPDNPAETDWGAVRSAICQTDAALKEDNNRIPLKPLFYESENGYFIFVEEFPENGWQVSRYTKNTDDFCTIHKLLQNANERLFVSGEWSSWWHADNTSRYTFPTATAAWEALKKWQEGNHA